MPAELEQIRRSARGGFGAIPKKFEISLVSGARALERNGEVVGAKVAACSGIANDQTESGDERTSMKLVSCLLSPLAAWRTKTSAVIVRATHLKFRLKFESLSRVSFRRQAR